VNDSGIYWENDCIPVNQTYPQEIVNIYLIITAHKGKCLKSNQLKNIGLFSELFLTKYVVVRKMRGSLKHCY